MKERLVKRLYSGNDPVYRAFAESLVDTALEVLHECDVHTESNANHEIDTFLRIVTLPRCVQG